MADTTTTRLSLVKPGVNDPAGIDLWGAKINSNLDLIDANMAILGQVEDVIAHYSVTAATDMIITLPAGYDKFRLEYWSYQGGSANVLSMRVSYDGATFFTAAGAYVYELVYAYGSTILALSSSTTEFAHMSVDPPLGDVTKGDGFAEIRPGSVSESFRIESWAGGYGNGIANMLKYIVSGTVNAGGSAARAQKIKLYNSTGTMTCKAILKGIRT